MVDSEVGEAHDLSGVLLCRFFIPLPGMSLAPHRLNASTCPMTEPPALRGRIISHQMKEKQIPVYTTTMEPPMMGTSWVTQAAATTSYKPDAWVFPFGRQRLRSGGPQATEAPTDPRRSEASL